MRVTRPRGDIFQYFFFSHNNSFSDTKKSNVKKKLLLIYWWIAIHTLQIDYLIKKKLHSAGTQQYGFPSTCAVIARFIKYEKNKWALDSATKLIKFAFISHTLYMMNGALRYISPQDLNPTQSMWRIASVTNLYTIGLDLFIGLPCFRVRSWLTKTRAIAFFISFYFKYSLLLHLLLLFEFHSQNLSWQTYGIALWVCWHFKHIIA